MKDESKELSVLYALSKAIVGARDTEGVLNEILNQTACALGVTKASIMKFDPKDQSLKVIAAKGLPQNVIDTISVKVGEGISGRVFKSKRPILISDIRDSRFKPRTRYRSKSLMSAPVTCLPMRVGGEPIGVINVTDRSGGREFTGSDLKLLTTIANQTAAYLHLCDLATHAKNEAVFRQELVLARGIQEKLLPKKMQKVEGFDIAGRCIMAGHVGGDYFDVIAFGARPPSVVVADVAGHGVGAAMTMSAFRSTLRTEGSASFLSPALVSERLNKLLYDDLVLAEQFISMAYVQLLHGVVRYTTCGHPAPLFFHKATFEAESTDDVALGIEKDSLYHERRYQIQTGDVLIIYTDGLLDARNSKGQKFGLNRLKEFIKRGKDKSSTVLVNGLCKEVEGFIGSSPLSDDVTVVITKKL